MDATGESPDSRFRLLEVSGEKSARLDLSTRSATSLLTIGLRSGPLRAAVLDGLWKSARLDASRPEVDFSMAA